MPKLSTRSVCSRCAAGVLACFVSAAGAGVLPQAASANSSQVSIIQDNTDLTNANGELAQFRALGANTVRVNIPWAYVAPHFLAKRKPNFNATDPNAYPAANWFAYDNIDRAAKADGLAVDFTVTGGAPVWAEGSGIPKSGAKNPNFSWKPNAKDFGQFVQAVGQRYDGSFKPAGQSTALPGVKFWSIYNEPNFGEDLGPQAIDGSHVSVAPNMFRGLLNAGWKALQQHHRGQTIIFGEFAARGITVYGHRGNPGGFPGGYGQTKPLIFIRTLYCVDGNYRPLRGRIAGQEGCPTNAAGSRSFRRNNPALFSASGVSDHPYADNPGGNQKPTQDGLNDPDFATFPALPRFGRALDRATGVYGAHPHFSIYNTEYGYITNPPSHKRYVSPTTAAWYINWAEYLSYKNPRIKSDMQYLLQDPPPRAGPYAGFASGLRYPDGKDKATFYAYRMPLYMPRVSFSRNQKVEVWGDVRPAPFATLDGSGPQRVQIQEQSGKSWKTINTARTGRGGYFDVRMKFRSSGRVRTQWTYPAESLLPSGFGGTITSRSFPVKVH